MSIEKIALLPVIDALIPLTQAVMYEVMAAKYLMLGIHDFRKLVDEGVIPCRTHPGRTRRIYLKTDLDYYLKNLPRCNISGGRVRPGPKGKGSQGDRL
jgi:hypothetical protein